MEPFLLIAATRILFPGPEPTIMATRTPSGATRIVVIAALGGSQGRAETGTSAVLASAVEPAAGSTRVCVSAATHRFPRSSQLSAVHCIGNDFLTAGGPPAAGGFLPASTPAASLIRYRLRPAQPAMVGAVPVDTATVVNGWCASPAGMGSGTGVGEFGRGATSPLYYQVAGADC